MSSTPLFRPEVTASRGQHALGAIRLAQPASSAIIAIFAAAIAGALVCFVWIGEYTKKARVTGIVMPSSGSISLAPTASGVLTRVLVKEGDAVKAGQAVFELSNERQSSQGEISALVAQQLAARRQSLETELRLRAIQSNEKNDALVQRMGNAEKEITQLQQELSLMKRRHTLAQETVARFQTLQASGYVSNAQVQQKQEELIDVSSRLSTLERNLLQLQASRSAIEAEIKTLASSLSTERAQLQRALAAVDQENAENNNRKNNFVLATQNGVLTTINGQLGQVVAAGQTIATMVPAQEDETKKDHSPITTSQLEAQLYAPSRTAGFVAVGQTVLIRFAAFPYQKFGLQKGTVVSVSTTPLAPSELPSNFASTILSNAQQSILGFNSNEALYRIKVKLEKQTIDAYNKQENLKAGMTLEADIVQDKRKIWEWITEPIWAITQR